MAEVRYCRFDPRLASLQDLYKRLRRLFNHLLLQTNGDVEQALEALERIGKHYGVLDERFTIDDFRRLLETERSVRRGQGGHLELSARGEHMIRAESLDAIFGALGRDKDGDHGVPREGEGRDRLPETRPFVFGDSVSLLDGPATITNTLRRCGIDDYTITEDDLRVHETEHMSSCATVMLVDVSHSMILYGEDRITPAKRVALALTELITTRYPRDSLDVVLFGDEAVVIPLEELTYIGVGPFHTNTRAGLRLAQEILRKKRHGNRQIFMITDGKPSALTERGGRIYKNPFGLDERIVNKTLDEAAQCRRLGIPVTTFMLTDDPVLVEFVDNFTRINRGRAYYSGSDRLGSYVLVDYIRNRRRPVR